MILRTLYETGYGENVFPLVYDNRTVSVLTDQPDEKPHPWWLVDEDNNRGLWISKTGIVGFQIDHYIVITYGVTYDIRKMGHKSPLNVKLKSPEYIVYTEHLNAVSLETILHDGMSIVLDGIRIVAGFDDKSDYMQWKISQ